MTEETLEGAYYRIARESAVWQERATRLQLTDAEREAVQQVIDAANGEATAEPWAVAALRGLLERLGHQ